MKLLHIDSSPLGLRSVSRELTRRIVSRWRAVHPVTEVEYLDLAQDAPSHLDLHSLGFRLATSDGVTDRQRHENAVSERLVTQFLAADVLVVGAPMYNFTIPSQLKAWIDRVAQAGRTFRYTPQGPQGLAGGKTVLVASSRGGAYASTPTLDHQERYLGAIFGFFGITDLRIVRAEGVNLGEGARERALAEAEEAIRTLVGEPATVQRGQAFGAAMAA